MKFASVLWILSSFMIGCLAENRPLSSDHKDAISDSSETADAATMNEDSEEEIVDKFVDFYSRKCTFEDCDDGDLCTVDVCVDGRCRYQPISCDDENRCTIDRCVEGQCVNEDTSCPADQICNMVSGECEKYHCSTNLDCPDSFYCAIDVCEIFVDEHGDTGLGQPGDGGGPNADGTPDSFDDDGDGYCETAPCVGSLDSTRPLESLLGGDCDDNPGSGQVPDGSAANNPGAAEWPDGFDNNCNGPIDESQ